MANASSVTSQSRSSARRVVLAAVALSSASGLVFEIVLTRIFAIAQFYHFAFMTVSLALLGLGASGSALAAYPRLMHGGRRRLAWFAAAQGASTLGAYALTNLLPFDSYSIAWDARQVVFLLVYYVSLAAPFFFSGLVVGALLSRRDIGGVNEVPILSHHVYAANLAGSGAGCVLALAVLARFGGAGAISAAALLALLGAMGLMWAAGRRWRGLTGLLGAGAILCVAWMVSPPPALELRLSPYKELSGALRYPGAQIVATRWNASSRVDLVESAGIRSLPGLSFTYAGDIPPQAGLTFDGDDLSPVPLGDAGQSNFTLSLLTALPYLLRPNADALILEPRGGLEVLTALGSGARSVRAVESNELALALANQAGGPAYGDPRVQALVDEPRAYVERSSEQIRRGQPGVDGALSLRQLGRVQPGRGLSLDGRGVRALPVAAEARRIAGRDALAADAAQRGNATAGAGRRSRSAGRRRSRPVHRRVAQLCQRFGAGQAPRPIAGWLSQQELDAIRSFAEARRFDLITAPGLSAPDANRYNVVPQDDYHRLADAVLTAKSPEPVYAAYPFDIAPPTDDHPFSATFSAGLRRRKSWPGWV